MINVNKLFPRLSIRAKLAVVLATVAMVPLVIVTISGSRASITQIRTAARATIDNDLRLAEMQTARSLETAERHVAFLAQSVLGPLLIAGPDETRWRPLALSVTNLVATEPTLRQVKLVDAEGSERLLVRGNAGQLETSNNARGTYYAWRANLLSADKRVLIPIELPDSGASPADRPIAAIAIVVPVFDSTGTFRGAVIGEAYAAQLFSDLDLASPGFSGTTALVDKEGRYLYHSVRKREWASLLATRDSLNLQSDVPASVATRVLAGGTGDLTQDDGIYAFRPLRLGSSGITSLTLVRIVPLDRLTLPVARFLQWVTAGGALVTGVVIIVAMLAATQFTRPIYQIREAAWRLARNEPPKPIDVATNDEFEDLASDFVMVGSAIARDRDQREALIAERTQLLESASARLDELLAHSADAIIGLDANGLVRLWNHGATRLFGYTAESAIGRSIEDLIEPESDSSQEKKFLAGVLARTGEVVNYRTSRRHENGALLPVSLTQTLVHRHDGQLIGASLIVRDDQMQARLDEHMRRSERLATMSVVGAGLAHEINNPLAIISNRIELMRRDARRQGPDARFESDLVVLEQHVQRLSTLCAELLRFAHDDADGVRVIELWPVAQRIAGLLERTLVSRQIKLQLAADPDVPAVRADEKGVETVLMNLILNAADATPPGGLVFLEARTAIRGDEVELIVSDSGPGISADMRERIFEPFFTTKQPGKGTGLGLTVCRTILERMGGSIGVDQSACTATGARLLVRLPMALAGDVA
ncbi:MAG: ATP-binding protein [Gemmatimonas sp.]